MKDIVEIDWSKRRDGLGQIGQIARSMVVLGLRVEVGKGGKGGKEVVEVSFGLGGQSPPSSLGLSPNDIEHSSVLWHVRRRI